MRAFHPTIPLSLYPFHLSIPLSPSLSLSLSLSLSPSLPPSLSLSYLFLPLYIFPSTFLSLSLLFIILFGVSNGRFRPCSIFDKGVKAGLWIRHIRLFLHSLTICLLNSKIPLSEALLLDFQLRLLMSKILLNFQMEIYPKYYWVPGKIWRSLNSR